MELEQALLLVPFVSACALLARLLPLLAAMPQFELLSKCVLFLLKLHHKQMVASASLIRLLHSLDVALRARLMSEQAVVGYNLAALRMIQGSLEASSTAQFYEKALLLKADADEASTAELRRQTVAAPRRVAKKRGPKLS